VNALIQPCPIGAPYEITAGPHAFILVPLTENILKGLIVPMPTAHRMHAHADDLSVNAGLLGVFDDDIAHTPIPNRGACSAYPFGCFLPGERAAHLPRSHPHDGHALPTGDTLQSSAAPSDARRQSESCPACPLHENA